MHTEVLVNSQVLFVSYLGRGMREWRPPVSGWNWL